MDTPCTNYLEAQARKARAARRRENIRGLTIVAACCAISVMVASACLRTALIVTQDLHSAGAKVAY